MGRREVQAAFVFLAVVRAGLPASAQPADKDALIRELMAITGAERNTAQMVDQVLPPMMGEMGKLFPSVPKNVWPEMESEMKAIFRQEIPAFVAASGRAYSRHYSAEEISGLLAFYKTPLGQKMLAVTPEIIRESSMAGMAWGQEIGQRAAQRVMDRLKAQGYQPRAL
jgi:hypothetical protein